MYRLILHGGAGGGSLEKFKAIEDKTGIDNIVEKFRSKLGNYVETGIDMLKNGYDSLTVVEKIINLLEDDEYFNAGKGAVRDETGKYTHDACIVDGSSGKFGAITQSENIKNPISMARIMMSQESVFNGNNTTINFIAKSNNLEIVENEYFQSDIRDNMASAYKDLGTVGVVALDIYGNISSGTSTGGLDGKLRGRVADSCICGISTVADSNVCGVSTTGKGEAIMKAIVGASIVHRMKFLGSSLEKAVDDSLGEVDGSCGIIAIDKNGNVYFNCNTPRMYVGLWDGNKIRTNILC